MGQILIDRFRIVPAPMTGIGWVAVQEWDLKSGAYKHYSSHRTITEAEEFIENLRKEINRMKLQMKPQISLYQIEQILLKIALTFFVIAGIVGAIGLISYFTTDGTVVIGYITMLELQEQTVTFMLAMLSLGLVSFVLCFAILQRYGKSV